MCTVDHRASQALPANSQEPVNVIALAVRGLAERGKNAPVSPAESLRAQAGTPGQINVVLVDAIDPSVNDGHTIGVADALDIAVLRHFRETLER